jgi:hypothetical protein
MRPIETNGAKLEIFATPDLRFGKEGIFWSEAFLLAQEGNPFDEDVSEIFADWEKPGRKGLRALRSYVARVLFDQFVLNVDVLQFERDDRPIASARKECERD